jgi:hypothetical protein
MAAYQDPSPRSNRQDIKRIPIVYCWINLLHVGAAVLFNPMASTQVCVRLALSTKVLLAKASTCGQPHYSSPISGLFPRLHLLSGYFNSNLLAHILHDIE